MKWWILGTLVVFSVDTAICCALEGTEGILMGGDFIRFFDVDIYENDFHINITVTIKNMGI